MISTTTMGNLKILIGADAAGVAVGVKDAEGSLAKLQSSVNRSADVLAHMAFAAAAAGAVMAAALVVKSNETIEAQSRLARQLGGTVEGVQAVERAASLAGISSEELTKASDNLNKSLGQATRDAMSPAADALRRIHLSAKDLSGLDVDTRFAAIASAIQKTGLNAQQTADLLGELGIKSGKLFNLFEEGGKAFREAREDVKLFGVAVSSFDARNLERANDAFSVFSLAMKGVGNQLAIELVPLLEVVGNHFRDAVKEGGGMGGIVAPAVHAVVYALGAMNREIALGRIAWDNLAALALDALDAVAGAIPRAIEKLTKGKITAADLGFVELKHEFGNLKDTLKPPDPVAWVDYFKNLTVQAQLAGITIKSIREAMEGPKPAADVDNLAAKERLALEKKLIALKEAIQSEDLAMDAHDEKQLKQLQELEQKKIVTSKTASDMRLQIESKHQDKLGDLIQTKFEAGYLTEQELLSRKFERQLADLRLFETNKTLTVASAEDIRKKMITQNAIDQLSIQAKGYSGLANIVDTAMGQISQIVADEGEKGFTVMKGIAVATALVKGYEAAVSAYAFGAKLGGPPLGAVMAGVAIAGTAAYIAKLSGVTASSSGSAESAGSAGGGAGVAASDSASSAAPLNPGRSMVVELRGRGGRYSADEIRDLMRSIEEWRSDGGTTGDRVVFS